MGTKNNKKNQNRNNLTVLSDLSALSLLNTTLIKSHIGLQVFVNMLVAVQSLYEGINSLKLIKSLQIWSLITLNIARRGENAAVAINFFLQDRKTALQKRKNIILHSNINIFYNSLTNLDFQLTVRCILVVSIIYGTPFSTNINSEEQLTMAVLPNT